MQMNRNVYMNRELSWLKFNERVLNEAANEEVPLCERLSFISIFQSNLDEFFMVRVGTLLEQMRSGQNMMDNKTNLTPYQQIREILKATKHLNEKKDIIYKELLGELKNNGFEIVDFQSISIEEAIELSDYFKKELAPLLSPTIIRNRQPFPFLKSKEIYAICILETKSGKEKLGIVPCYREIFQKLIPLNTMGKYVLAEQLLLYFLPKVFKGYKVLSKSLIRVTRNADMDTDELYDEEYASTDDYLDYRQFMSDLMKQRKKLNPVRLEMSEKDEHLINMLFDYLDLEKDYVFYSESPLEFSFLSQIRDYFRKEKSLFYPKRVPQKSSSFQENMSILEQIKEEDKLLSYPFESINPFIKMLQEAANDRTVVSIKMTLYRLAENSKIIEALLEAAENGKEVIVLLELKARFDEENNIEWSRTLEEAGCRVIYGIDGYKVHSKLCLITQITKDGTTYYTQIGTGNYNEKTSKLYTDLSYMTARTEIGLEASKIFQELGKGELVNDVNHLLVAPNCLQNKVIEMIDEEISHAKHGEESYIGLKINSLTDKIIMDKLIEASCAGVTIDLIVRGICCLIPKVKGKTENIRVISIVGRYLEHSRIYIFGCGERRKVYISSADFMTRNTRRRVEVAVPIKDSNICERINKMFITMLNDNQKANEMDMFGDYQKITSDGSLLNSQEMFLEEAYRKTISQENVLYK